MLTSPVGTRFCVDAKIYNTASLQNNTICVGFTDPASQYTKLYYAADRRNVVIIFDKFYEHCLQNKIPLETIHSDNEYISSYLEHWHTNKLIKTSTTAPHSSKQNPFIERMWRTIFDNVRANLVGAGLSTLFWQYASEYVRHTYNRLRSPNRDDTRPPISKLFPSDKRYNTFDKYGNVHVTYFRSFGCRAYAHKQNVSKGENARARQAIFVGYKHDSQRAYVLYDPSTKQEIISRDVTFNENKRYRSDDTQHEPELDITDLPTTPAPALPKDTHVQSDNQQDKQLPGEEARTDMSPASLIGKTVRRAFQVKRKWYSFRGRIISYDANRKWFKVVYAPSDIYPEEDSEDLNIHQVRKHLESAEQLATLPHVLRTTHNKNANMFISNTLARQNNAKMQRNMSTRIGRKADDTGGANNDDSMRLMHTYLLAHGVLPPALDTGIFAVNLPPEPTDLRDALDGDEGEQWKRAIIEEVGGLVSRQTFRREPTRGRKKLLSRFVFKRKLDANGNILKYKARLVAKGYAQREGVDYRETFAPVLHMTSLRTLIAMAHKHQLIIRQVDVDQAYLYGRLREEILLELPPGIDAIYHELNLPPISTNEGLRLLKSIYGLKQAGAVWHATLKNVLIGAEFVKCETDDCMYSKSGIIVGIYVDDIVIVTKAEDTYKQFIDLLKGHFSIKEMGNIDFILGIKVSRKGSTLTMTQTSHIESVVNALNLRDANTTTTPIYIPRSATSTNENNMNDENNASKRRATRTANNEQMLSSSQSASYRSAVGALLYIASCTRPDIMYAVSILCAQMSAPSVTALKQLKHTVRYLKGTAQMGITITTSKQTYHNSAIVAYSDSDFATDVATRKSRSGIVLHVHGTPVQWISKKQSIIAASVAEAEYYAIESAARHAQGVLRLCRELRFVHSEHVVVMSDNTSAIRAMQHGLSRSAMKHMDVRQMRARELVENKQLVIDYVPTADNPADVLTKAVSHAVLSRLRNCLLGDCLRPAEEAN